MEKREYWVYKFNELSEEGKRKAIERYSDINVDFEWWDSTYDDAKNIGLEITEFDLYCRTIRGKFTMQPEDVIKKIFSDHGKGCETYKTAKKWKEELKLIQGDGEYDDLSEDFLKELLEDYKTILQNEYEYLTEEEQIRDTLVSNEYDFTADGKID